MKIYLINEVDNKILFSSSVELRDHFSLVYQDQNTLKIVSISQKTHQGTVEKNKQKGGGIRNLNIFINLNKKKIK